MRVLMFLFLATLHQYGWTQSDQLITAKGIVTMTPILHATTVLEWNEKTIYMDPYGGADKFHSFKPADIICITHSHGDHLNKATLKDLDLTKTTLVAPQSVVDDLGEIVFAETIVLENGEQTKLFEVEIGAVPMYNLPDDQTSRHPKGWGNGYVLSIGDKKFYFSGDTEDIAEMRALEGIDFAFVCMNLPYTMTIEQAADAVLEFKPTVVYPFHYRGQNGMSDVQKFKTLINEEDNGIEVRLRDWYP